MQLEIIILNGLSQSQKTNIVYFLSFMSSRLHRSMKATMYWWLGNGGDWWKGRNKEGKAVGDRRMCSKYILYMHGNGFTSNPCLSIINPCVLTNLNNNFKKCLLWWWHQFVDDRSASWPSHVCPGSTCQHSPMGVKFLPCELWGKLPNLRTF